MKALFLAARLVLGLVLLAAAALKGLDPRGSVIVVAKYELTPEWLTILGGLVLPGIEAVAGAALLTGYALRGAAVVGAALSTLFASGVVSVMTRQLDIHCGCFGKLSFTPRANFGTLSIDVALLIMALLVLYGTCRREPR